MQGEEVHVYFFKRGNHNQAASDVRKCETQKTVSTIYMVCHCVGKKNPIRRVKTKPQMATVVSLWSFDGVLLNRVTK